jgi:protein-tyrosine kinase
VVSKFGDDFLADQAGEQLASLLKQTPLRIDVPHVGTVKVPGEAQIVVGFDNRDERSRPFNLLRGQLLRRSTASNLRVVAVTSATPRTGKSFVAVNLAAALSRLADLNTYLFDLDLRRSSVASYLGISGELGLIDFLDGTIPSLDDLAWGVEGERLTVFPCFPKSVRSAEVLAGARMDALIDAMRRAPGPALCLCDLPPAFANDDAVIISQKMDGYVLVIEDGVTTAKQVRDAMRLLEPAICLGTILNRYHGGVGGDDYGYGYGVSHAYSEYYN